MKPTRLSRPPIIEALIDIRFQGSGAFTIEAAKEFALQSKAEGDAVQERYSFESEIQIGESETPPKPAKHELEAVIIRSESGKVAQFRRSGFTVSLIKAYEKWEDLEAHARAVFDPYVAASRPLAITRIATRFINLIEVPESTFDLDDFLEAGPSIPANSFDHVREFSHRAVFGTAKEGPMGILNVGTHKSGPGQSSGLLIDVDCFFVDAQHSMAVNFDALVPILSELRRLKNSLFFGSLKQRALELYS